jgi:ankyrin repeat protein
VSALVARGARIDDMSWWGRGALHFAAKAGFTGTIRVLLEAGADPNLRDHDGATPLDHALRAGKSVDPRPVIALLRAAGAKGGAPTGEARRRRRASTRAAGPDRTDG